jgi:hypothetical protein
MRRKLFPNHFVLFQLRTKVVQSRRNIPSKSLHHWALGGTKLSASNAAMQTLLQIGSLFSDGYLETLPLTRVHDAEWQVGRWIMSCKEQFVSYRGLILAFSGRC